MNRLGTHALPFLAGTLSIALLAGCPNAGTAPPVGEQPTTAPGTSTAPVNPSPSASASSSASSTASPTTPGSNGSTAPATPAPIISAPVPPGEKKILQGKVYSEAGSVVEGAIVSIRSLDNNVPYSATTQTVGGNYVVNDVPVGANIEVSISKDGWTTRRRVKSIQVDTTRNVLDFGSAGSVNDDDSAGGAYFISDFPEVVSASPATSPVKTGDELVYKVTFSEPLDSLNQAIVRRGFTIRASAPGSNDLVPDGQTPQTIEMKDGSVFLGTLIKLTTEWDAEGRALTIKFKAPLRSQKNTEDKSYSFRIIRLKGENVITDASKKALGYDGGIAEETGIYRCFKKSNLALKSGSSTADKRWEDTHNTSSSFDVARDEVKPTVVSVETNNIIRNGVDCKRIEVKFSEPMRVYPEANGYAKSAADKANYILCLYDSTKVEDKDLRDDTTNTYNVGTGLLSFVTAQKHFKLGTGVEVVPSDSDPTVISIFLKAADVPAEAKRVRVLVKTDVLDPAGNRVSEQNRKGDNTADNCVDGII